MSKLQVQEAAVGSSEARMSFSKDTSNYDAIRESYGPLVDKFLKANPLPEGAVIADLGAGTGLLGKEFVKRGYTVHFVDPDAKMLEKCKANVEGFTGKRAGSEFTLNHGAADHIPLAPKSVDLFIGGDTAHWWSKEEVVREQLNLVGKDNAKMLLIWRQLNQADQFTKDLDAHLSERSEAYKSARGRFVMDDSRRPETVAHRFIDSTDSEVATKHSIRNMTADAMVKLAQSWASTQDYVSDEKRLKGFHEFLANKVQDSDGNIHTKWETTTIYGAPIQAEKKLSKVETKEQGAQTELTISPASNGSWVERSGSPRAQQQANQR